MEEESSTGTLQFFLQKTLVTNLYHQLARQCVKKNFLQSITVWHWISEEDANNSQSADNSLSANKPLNDNAKYSHPATTAALNHYFNINATQCKSHNSATNKQTNTTKTKLKNSKNLDSCVAAANTNSFNRSSLPPNARLLNLGTRNLFIFHSAQLYVGLSENKKNLLTRYNTFQNDSRLWWLENEFTCWEEASWALCKSFGWWGRWLCLPCYWPPLWHCQGFHCLTDLRLKTRSIYYLNEGATSDNEAPGCFRRDGLCQCNRLLLKNSIYLSILSIFLSPV